MDREYKNYEEVFDNNCEYFNSNEKKAWFIMGVAYSYVKNMIKKNIASKKNIEGKEKVDLKTSLDKNFFFSKKFNFKDYIHFANTLTDKLCKYKLPNESYINQIICNGKEFMANSENEICYSEAKYIFFWGIETYFYKEEVRNKKLIDFKANTGKTKFKKFQLRR